MKSVVFASVAAVTLLLVSVAAVGAASSGPRSAGASFCVASKNVASDLVNIQKQLQSAPNPTRLKAEYGAIIAAEPALRSSAPGNLKGNVNTVLTLANNIAGYLKKANWSITGILPYVSTIEVQVNKAKPSLDALDHYYKVTCKFKV